MRRPLSTQTILKPFLSGMLLITAACGDFQDPVSGSQGTALSSPSGSQAPQQRITGNESLLAPAPPGYAVDPARLPVPMDTAPASTETSGVGPLGNMLANESAAEQLSPPPHSVTTQLSNGVRDSMSQWFSPDGTQPVSVGSEVRPQTKSVTFEWDPSLSGNADGYRVYVMTMSASMQYTFEAGPKTQHTVELPLGKNYYFTVVAYNVAGESPRASPVQFNLF